MLPIVDHADLGFAVVILFCSAFVIQQWLILKWQSQTQEEFMALADDLAGIKATLDKARAEIISKVTELELALADSATTSENVTAAVAELRTVAQSLDDVVPDAVEAEVPAEAPTEVPTDLPADVPAEAPAEVPSETPSE